MNWRALIFLFLPTDIRNAFWIDFLYAGMKKIRDLEAELIEAKAGIFTKAKQNSQQGPLGKLLSDLTGRTVVITTIDRPNTDLTIWLEEEEQDGPWVRNEGETGDEQLYIYEESEQANPFDFVVTVSGSASDAITAKIISVVNRVKLAGKRYRIEYTGTLGPIIPGDD